MFAFDIVYFQSINNSRYTEFVLELDLNRDMFIYLGKILISCNSEIGLKKDIRFANK